MSKALIILVAASQMYQAQVTTFGCNSTEDFLKLQQARTDTATFWSLLNERLVQGECVLFAKGATVEGEDTNLTNSSFHIQAHFDPPGYIAPLQDFRIKDAAGQQPQPSQQ
jgi:hypothetical protein